jgi:hypothetical protein
METREATHTGSFLFLTSGFLFDWAFQPKTAIYTPIFLLCLNNLHPPLNLILIDFQLISKST